MKKDINLYKIKLVDLKETIEDYLTKSLENDNQIFYDGFLNLNELVFSGVYLLGDFYVGRTKDLKKRLYGHASNIYRKHNRVYKGAMSWFDRYGTTQIPVFLLSTSLDDEYDITWQLINHGFPIESKLINCQGYKDLHISSKEHNAIKYLESLGYKINTPDSRKLLRSPSY